MRSVGRDMAGFMIEPQIRYEPRGTSSFERLLGFGWSDVEDWGVWSCDRVATLNLHVDPALCDTHVLKLYGEAFVNPQHPQVLVEAFVNSTLATRRVINEPGDDEVLQIPLRAINRDGGAVIRLAIDSPISPQACDLNDDSRELGFGLKAISLEPAAEYAGPTIEPFIRYQATGPNGFSPFLGEGWSEVEDWGVWSCDRMATLNLRVDPMLRDTHVLTLYGEAFVNPQQPQVTIEAFVNSALALRYVFASPADDQALEIPLQALDRDGSAIIRLAIDSPTSPLACGIHDDARELGFGLKTLSVQALGEHSQKFPLQPLRRYDVRDATDLEAFLGSGWSGIEGWGVWSRENAVTLNFRVDPALKNTHILKLFGKGFVIPEHPKIVVEASVNSVTVLRHTITEPGDDEMLEIPLEAINDDGSATIRLLIDAPKAPAACGLNDDTRELGFGLTGVLLDTIGGQEDSFIFDLRHRYETQARKQRVLLR
jgi:translation elongation factor EF-1beta